MLVGSGAIVVNDVSGGSVTPVAGPVCGASLNPARSLAPALLTGTYTSLWLYLVAPVCGALVGVGAWRAVRG